jgi:hypothetical protein
METNPNNIHFRSDIWNKVDVMIDFKNEKTLEDTTSK